MLRHLDPSDRRLIVQLAVIAVISLTSVFFVGRYAETVFLQTESEAASVRMAQFLRQGLSDLDRILNEGVLTDEDRALFRDAARMGGVFRYKLFNSDGRIVHASRSEDIGKRVTEPYFDAVVRQGESYFHISFRPIGTTAYTDELGTPYEENVVLVSERYVPIMEGPVFKGAVEVYIDMTPLRQRLRKATWLVIAGISFLLIVVCLACGAFIDRNFKDRRRRMAEISEARDVAKNLAHRAETMLKGLLVAEQEKMSRVVNLLGGVAHEIGNPLTTLSANLEALENPSPAVADVEFRRRVDDMREAVRRLGSFLHDITGFSDQDDDDSAGIDINEIIRGLAGLVQLDDRARKAQFMLALSPDIAPLSLPHQCLSLALFIVFSVAAENLNGAPGRVRIGTAMVAADDRAEIRVATTPTGSFGESPAPLTGQLREPVHPALQTARSLVESFGGSMAVTADGPAKEFRLVLPRKATVRDQPDDPAATGLDQVQLTATGSKSGR